MAKRPKARSVALIEYGAYRAARLILRIVGKTGTRWLATMIAAMLRVAAVSRTRTARENLARCFPEWSGAMIDRTVRRCWRHFTIQSLEYVRTLDEPLDPTTNIRVTGREPLDAIIERGRGVVLFTAHFGDWESAIAALETLSIPFSIVARPLDNPFLQRDIERARARNGMKILARRKAARTMREWIAQGKGVVVLPDQAVKPREGLLVPFLGRPAWTTPAPAKLAIRNGAAIVGAFCYPAEDGGLHIELTDVVDTSSMEGGEADVESLTTWISDRISEHVRRAPHLWLWMHDRWKRAPDDRR